MRGKAEKKQRKTNLWNLWKKFNIWLPIWKISHFFYPIDFFILSSRKLRMASILNSEGSLIKDLNIQRKAINGSQVLSEIIVMFWIFFGGRTSCSFIRLPSWFQTIFLPDNHPLSHIKSPSQSPRNHTRRIHQFSRLDYIFKHRVMKKFGVWSLQACLVWNQMNSKQIQSLKQGRLSLVLKLKKQQTAGLVGDISVYESYSEGESITYSVNYHELLYLLQQRREFNNY